jgi:hypothetical protein
MGFPLVVMRVKKWGDSWVIILPRTLREELGLTVGDLVAMRIHKPYATLCRWRPEDVIPLGTVDVAKLPPLSPRELKNVRD